MEGEESEAFSPVEGLRMYFVCSLDAFLVPNSLLPIQELDELEELSHVSKGILKEVISWVGSESICILFILFKLILFICGCTN